MSAGKDLGARLDKLEVVYQQQEKRLELLETQVDAAKPTVETYYLTTAIPYTNGLPHMGHAYENVCSDVIARYHRVFGRGVHFLTGTDEHGQRLRKLRKLPKLVDKYATIFEQLMKDLNMSNSNFIRTTSDVHKFAQWLFQRALYNGDVYLGTYEGCYNPEVRRQELLCHLKEPLQDLSASRNTFTHGIPLLNDPEHVLYVWFDALANYLSAIGYPTGPNARYWPANVHNIGKDITWFHCIIWPCILISADIPLPKQVFAHGFVNAKDRSKMNKSNGNNIDANEMVNKYGLEAFRYFIMW
ncbi:hypothetical protein PsorP6_017837 [Peronosclerospora sorghi]|uniref:Uncharacterized protein n=1 Tax=Peronosclerospora sorghi TaxID=230839 RepID=A0ACC0WDI8_9STRA|nr:hypothetical protein PsorP6_017837 [Peronosclerospora sorghi]